MTIEIKKTQTIYFKYELKRNKSQVIGLVSLFNGISTFVGYLMPMSSLKKDRKSWSYLFHIWGDKGVRFFLKSESERNCANGIQLEIEHADYDITVQQVSHYAIDLMSWVFANGPGNRGSIPGRVIPKTKKMVLDVTLLNTQHYKVRIKESGAIQRIE